MSNLVNFDNITPEEFDKLRNDYTNFGGIIFKDETLYNPIECIHPELQEKPHLYYTWLLCNPEYLHFIAKEFLNVDLLPFQVVILQEIWNRKFPMLVASRGAGKATTLDTPVLTNNGFVRMGDIKVGDKVYSRNGKLCNVLQIYPQGKKQVYRVELIDGRFVDCCEDHLWVVKKNNKEKVLSTKEIFNSPIFYKKKENNSVTYKYSIPNCEPIEYSEQTLDIDPYILGCLLGDGCMTTLTPKIASKDDFIINEFRNRLVDFEINLDNSTDCNYTIVDRNKDYKTIIAGNRNYEARCHNRLTQKIKSLNLNVSCKYKFIPDIYKYSSVEQRMELVRGLLDTDGSINKDGAIEFTNTCEQLVDDLAEILRSLGITCSKGFDKREGEDHCIKGHKCLRSKYYRLFINTSLPVFKLPRKLERIKRGKTNRESYVSIKNIIKLNSFQEMQCISVDSVDNTYITKDFIVTHNSFCLAIYVLLRALLLPERKIVVAGASFRQSKLIYQYCCQIWNNAPLLRNSILGYVGGYGERQGQKGGADSVYFYIGDSQITFIPVGCLHPDSFVTTDTGIKTIKSLENNFNKVYGDNKHRDVGFFYDSGISPAYKVKTSCGYEYIGTPNHKMKVVRDQLIQWIRTDELKLGDKILIDRSIRWFNPTFACTNDQAYCLGLLLGDGNYTHKDRLRFTTIDKEFIQILNNTIGEFKPESDDLHYNLCGRQKRKDWLNFWGLESKKSYEKILPDTILSSSKENVASCLSGLFDTDGHVLVDESKGGLASSVNLTTTSKILAQQVQYILLHFGIISSIRVRKDRKSSRTGNKVRDCYELGIYGKNVKIFYEFIGFRLSRKKELLEYAVTNKKRWITNSDTIPVNISSCKYVTNRKTLTFDKYYEYRKYFDEYFKNYLDLFNENNFYDEVISVEEQEDQQMYDINVPEGNIYCANGFYSHNTGETIRGLRANDIIVDEFKSLSREIFENVIAGFGAVESSPQKKVASNLEKEFNDLFNVETLNKRDILDISNQIVISGTAYYYFNHFAEYWERWRQIVLSRGNPAKILEIFPDGPPDGFDWKDYSVIRLPYDVLPKRYMDSGNIARSKATLHRGLFEMEFGAVFSRDSDGFFKASLIQSCIADLKNNIEKDGEIVNFLPSIYGDPNKKYYMGIDTASQVDNFAIVILEIENGYRKIVYCWTTNTKEFKVGKQQGKIEETDFFQYCSRKIRDLMGRFQIQRISIDSQGGGRTIYESLHDKDKLKPGEQMLWEIIEPDKKKDTDAEEGLHIIEMVQFRKAEYTSSANHNLRKDFEDKNCLFPEYNPAILASYANIENSYFQEMEDCIENIEALKMELTTIIVTTTATGIERFDTPEVKLEGDKKGRVKKDRYTALLMANMAARTDYHMDNNYFRKNVGEVANISLNEPGAKFIGPAWITKNLDALYD